jgi:hypothetical protein
MADLVAVVAQTQARLETAIRQAQPRLRVLAARQGLVQLLVAVVALRRLEAVQRAALVL